MAIEKPLKLACGQVLRNRLAKSAMSENLAEKNLPGEKLCRLYETWGAGGLGLIITGNVMVDGDELGEPNNVVLDSDRDLDKFRAWTSAAKKNGAQIWAQINHPGRQAPSAISRVTVAPSAIKLKVGNLAFREPHALTDFEIRGIIQKFARTAELCKQAGFDGVQIHGAHGYLVSQFLSPLSNVRHDDWGGSVENRMLFPIEIVRALRAAVGEKFPIGIKMNSADFQRGGFAEEDSIVVAKALEKEGIDLLEISGGSYESSVMTGKGISESTAAREAYFLPFAEKIRKAVKVPLMLTGGFRSTAAMNAAVESGAIDVVGIARPLAMEPALANRLLSDPNARTELRPVKTGIAAIDKMGMLEIGYYSLQLKRIGEGKSPDPELSPLLAIPLLGFNYTSGILGRMFR